MTVASTTTTNAERPTKRLKSPPPAKANGKTDKAASGSLKLAAVGEAPGEKPGLKDPPPPPATEPQLKEDNEMKVGATTTTTTTTTENQEERGFTVQCKNGGIVKVSAGEAIVLKQNSEFFRNAFRHGTQESQSGKLLKPDWTKETADHVVDLVLQGRCEIPLDYRSLHKAASQILIPLRVRHPLNGRDISQHAEVVQSLAKQWTKKKSQFVLETPLLNDTNKWQELFNCGVVVIRNEKDLVVESKGQSQDNDDAAYKSTKFLVGASSPLCVSAYHACFVLSGFHASSQKQEHDTSSKQFELFFQANFGAGAYLRQKLGRGLQYQKCTACELVRYRGQAEDLCRVLETLDDFIIPPNICMLSVANPNSWVLGRLIRAAQHCDDNPATLGWKTDENSFYAVKTISDIRIMLSILADPATEAAASGHLHIKDHSFSQWKAF